MRRTMLALLALASLALTLPWSPTASASCNEQRTEVIGLGEESTGVYSREKTDDYGNCRYSSSSTWEQNCTSSVTNPFDTPSDVTVPEVRVLGQVVVPQTTVGLPVVHVPGVSQPSRPTSEDCGVSSTDYGVYDGGTASSYWANYRTYVGTDGCNAGPNGYSVFLLGWGYTVCPLL